MTKAKQIILFSVLAAALVGPFLAGSRLAGPEYVFGGFYLNPQDGNSYLAKMRLGWQGEWRFQLPYSLETGDGAYLFLFYILLGHLSRITSLPILLVFHLARILSSALLVYAIVRLYRRWSADFSPGAFLYLTALTIFGSGLGWVAALFGVYTSDLTVPEAYPFLSMFVNPHFPLGLGMLLIYLDLFSGGLKWRQAPFLFLFGGILAIIQPFSIVIAAVITAGFILWQWKDIRRLSELPAVGFFSGGGAVLLYQFISIRKDPILSLWDAQNITPAPPVWDVVVSFSPALLFAVVQVVYLARRRQLGRYKLFVIWLAAGITLLYLPFSLQRRFLTGYFLPCAFLGVMAVIRITKENIKNRRVLSGIVLVASLMSNLFLLLGGLGAVAGRNSYLVFSKEEKAAFDWMSDHFDAAGPILASVETGMYIPAYTGWRVVYGHPFETINAEQRKSDVEAVFDGRMSVGAINTYMAENGIRIVFWGPREQESRGVDPFSNYPAVYQNQRVKIYLVEAEQ